jgi:hypothetical protein
MHVKFRSCVKYLVIQESVAQVMSQGQLRLCRGDMLPAAMYACQAKPVLDFCCNRPSSG